MHTRLIMRYMILVLVATSVVGAVLYILLQRPSMPWENTGRLVVVTRPIVTTYEGPTLSFVLGDLRVLRDGTPAHRLTLRTKQIFLGPELSETRTVVLDTQIKEGQYDGITTTLLNPGFVGAFDDGVLPRITLPGNTLTISAPFSVEEGMTTVVMLAFELDQTLQKASDDSYTYLPVVQVETRHGAQVETQGSETAVSGGAITSSRTFGMDSAGTLRFNYREPNVGDAVNMSEGDAPLTDVPVTQPETVFATGTDATLADPIEVGSETSTTSTTSSVQP